MSVMVGEVCSWSTGIGRWLMLAVNTSVYRRMTFVRSVMRVRSAFTNAAQRLVSRPFHSLRIACLLLACLSVSGLGLD